MVKLRRIASRAVPAALGLGLVLASTGAAAQNYANSAKGYANVFTGLVNNWANVDTGQLTQPLLPFAATALPNMQPDVDASLSGQVATGRISFQAAADAGYDSYGGAGTISMSAAWSDTLTLQSASLPAGTSVSLQFTLVLSGALGISGDQDVPAHIQDANSADLVASMSPQVSLANPQLVEGGILQGGTFGSGPDFPAGSYSTLGASNVGSSFQLSGDVSYYVVASSGQVSPLVQSFISGTAMVYVTVLTPGVTVASASGYDYAPAAVPEPPAAALWLAGLAGMAGLARRRVRF